MKNMNLLMSILQLLQTTNFPPVLAQAHFKSAPAVDIQITVMDQTETWLLTCTKANGDSWQFEIEGAIEEPQRFIDGNRLWIGLSFRDAVYLDRYKATQHPERAGFWAVLDLKDGRLLGSGKVTGSNGIIVAGFVATSGNLDLVGVHGESFFVLPVATPFSSEHTEPMVTSVRIGDPQPHTDNPTPPDKP